LNQSDVFLVVVMGAVLFVGDDERLGPYVAFVPRRFYAGRPNAETLTSSPSYELA
jgi:hypothetical protein